MTGRELKELHALLDQLVAGEQIDRKRYEQLIDKYEQDEANKRAHQEAKGQYQGG